MAVYKLFPIQDATLYSEFNTMNTGMDEILDLSKSVSYAYPSYSAVSRALVQFSQEEIQNVYSNYVSTKQNIAELKLYLSEDGNISPNFSLEVAPVGQSWVMGTGKYGDTPEVSNGANWKTKDGVNAWASAPYSASMSGSYFTDNPGGGNWVTGSVVTASFTPYQSLDISVDVTSTILKWVTGSVSNNGFIIRNTSDAEFDKTKTQTLQYFSRDTNTIYPPTLDLKWDDSVYSPSSQSLICTDANINVSLGSGVLSYQEDAVHKVRINVRDKYPTRTFTTGSLYNVHKYLPSSSYWSIRDYKTKDVVVDFDTTFTKISADSNGNYFTLFMNGLEPSRYYEVLIKSNIGTEVVVFDKDNIFKVE